MENGNWVCLDDDSIEVESKHIESFYWRSRDEESELHVIFIEDGFENPRYKFFNVSRSLYEEFVDRIMRPEAYMESLEYWFKENIRGEYEFDRYKA